MIRDFVLSFLLSATLITALIAGMTTERRPYLVLRASPRVAVQPARVTFTALIEGDINEAWYCPKVEWTWSNGTHSVEESDCPPFEEGKDEAQRIWSRHLLLGEGIHEIEVTLSKPGRVLGRERITVEVH